MQHWVNSKKYLPTAGVRFWRLCEFSVVFGKRPWAISLTTARHVRLFWLYLPRMPCSVVRFLLSLVSLALNSYEFYLHQSSLQQSRDSNCCSCESFLSCSWFLLVFPSAAALGCQVSWLHAALNPQGTAGNHWLNQFLNCNTRSVTMCGPWVKQPGWWQTAVVATLTHVTACVCLPDLITRLVSQQDPAAFHISASKRPAKADGYTRVSVPVLGGWHSIHWLLLVCVTVATMCGWGVAHLKRAGCNLKQLEQIPPSLFVSHSLSLLHTLAGSWLVEITKTSWLSKQCPTDRIWVCMQSGSVMPNHPKWPKRGCPLRRHWACSEAYPVK